MNSSKAYAIKKKDDGKFYVSHMSGHYWAPTPLLGQLDNDRLETQRAIANLQLNRPEYRDMVEICEITLS